MKNRTLFVSGVHGVGKTTFCRDAARALSIHRYSASEVIRAERDTSSLDTAKHVHQISRNQEYLVHGVEKLCRAHTAFILDGHFALLNSSGTPTPIEVTVFKDLRLASISVILDDPDQILLRLAGRDDKHPSIDQIRNLQNLEIAVAKEVSGILNVALHIYAPGEVDLFIKDSLDLVHNIDLA